MLWLSMDYPSSIFGPAKTVAENWDSKAASAGTILAYLETTA